MEQTLLEGILKQACVDFKVSAENRKDFRDTVSEMVELGSEIPFSPLNFSNVMNCYARAARQCKADCTLVEEAYADAASITVERYFAELSVVGSI